MKNFKFSIIFSVVLASVHTAHWAKMFILFCFTIYVRIIAAFHTLNAFVYLFFSSCQTNCLTSGLGICVICGVSIFYNSLYRKNNTLTRYFVVIIVLLLEN